MHKKDTSWGNVASWYDEYLEKSDGTYQKEVILPNLLRVMEIKKGENVLDLACGQGFFSREFVRSGANVIGVDIAPELIALAKKNAPKEAEFFVSSADKLSQLKDGLFDKAVVVLAIQNIENLDGTLSECKRVLKKGGKLFLVMNHPAYRVPQKSDWGFDEKTKVTRLEEWISNKKSQKGPREKEEDKARHEIPLFLLLETLTF